MNGFLFFLDKIDNRNSGDIEWLLEFLQGYADVEFKAIIPFNGRAVLALRNAITKCLFCLTLHPNGNMFPYRILLVLYTLIGIRERFPEK